MYEKASGQQLNRAKTTLFFSSNTDNVIQEEIKLKFGAQVIQQHEKYLSLPSLEGRKICNTFNDIKEKLAQETSWLERKVAFKDGK